MPTHNQIIEEKKTLEERFDDEFEKSDLIASENMDIIRFIRKEITSAEQAGYNRAMGEARDKIEDDKKKKCYGADGHFFTEGWKWTAMGYDNALNILRSLTPTDNNKEV